MEDERLLHAYGMKIIDEDASNNRAWYASDSIPCPIHLVYGPYEDLPNPGVYKAIFKMKIDSNFDNREVLHIDVISNKNPGMNSFRQIHGNDFDQPGVYQYFEVQFAYGGESDIEYRVIKQIQERIFWIDYISVIKHEEKAYA